MDGVAAVDEFVAQVRARRLASGRPARIEDEGVYRIVDGLLAERLQEGVRHNAA